MSGRQKPSEAERTSGYGPAEFRISVRPSPETNDHEVCLLTADENLIDRFSVRMMGLDPDDLLVEPCRLSAQGGAHRATIGRCNCGVIGCGSIEVDIQREGDQVTWQARGSSIKVRFLAAQYDAEVDRALTDFSWETPDRTAARLIAKAVDRALLGGRGFSFSWASGRCGDGMMTAALSLKPGPYQVLLNLPWDGKDVEKIVDRFKLVLSAAPESWSDVQWSPQIQGLGPPPIEGPGWRKWGA